MYECNASSSICHCCISFGGVELFGAFHFDTACFDDAYDVAHVESRMNMMSVMPLYRLALVRFPFLLPSIVGVVGCWMVGSSVLTIVEVASGWRLAGCSR